MTWTKLSDDFSDDCWSLSDAAFRLHTEGLVWSNRKLLDLRIPKADVRRFARNGELGVSELLACDWWRDEGDNYVLRHHGAYQRDRASVLRQQEVNKANRARGKARPTSGTGAPREQAVDPSPVSSDESSNGSTDERDWTGRDGTGSYKGTQQNERIDLATGEVLDDPWKCCSDCGKSMNAALWAAGERTHPTCDPNRRAA